ncbi:MAG: hypothetical protein A2365_03600 [Candidatus Nealsonbacteria bacterium RIFOXYB1_FULL_40_15]|uniref:VIT family protein n=1 Tax=Candidatus Nealsonbacteria bacterium RIFOXYB1_FULL_40_15 TaxID=1801677 RepID=A0A1G2EQ84_9BACT|nr:MAG: hypothetical protein A2365_03600 [Candidatus Nealsonbacteria bacterium RIFOXYB1_FULL_40_15]
MKEYIHHKNFKILSNLREITFGIEDGIVSTLGALTGIAVGSKASSFVIFSGIIIVLVEAFSMSIGSYFSTRSQKEFHKKILSEEKKQLETDPESEKRELFDFYIKDGWSKDMATRMVQEASAKNSLFLKEMSYRELGTVLKDNENPVRAGILMFFFYVLGGVFPVLPYAFLPIFYAMFASAAISLASLFLLGAITSLITGRNWLKSGAELFLIAGIAALAGWGVGILGKKIIGL